MRGGSVRLLGWLAAFGIMWAGQAAAGQPPISEDRLRDAGIRIDRAAAALGEAETVTRLAVAFKLSGRAVTDLHDQKLDYGEVATVLALAEASKTKPEAILSLWATGRLNWSEIADRNKVDGQKLLKRLEAVRRALLPPRPTPSPRTPTR
jgi:hypothetical protein